MSVAEWGYTKTGRRLHRVFRDGVSVRWAWCGARLVREEPNGPVGLVCNRCEDARQFGLR